MLLTEFFTLGLFGMRFFERSVGGCMSMTRAWTGLGEGRGEDMDGMNLDLVEEGKKRSNHA
jgi:hypothetical protein